LAAVTYITPSDTMGVTCRLFVLRRLNIHFGASDAALLRLICVSVL